jgi:hypothetical protein
MASLSITTVRVFTAWMTVAVIGYFAYGLRRSRLNLAP